MTAPSLRDCIAWVERYAENERRWVEACPCESTRTELARAEAVLALLREREAEEAARLNPPTLPAGIISPPLCETCGKPKAIVTVDKPVRGLPGRYGYSVARGVPVGWACADCVRAVNAPGSPDGQWDGGRRKEGG